MFAHTGRRQAAVTPHMTLTQAAEEQCTSMQAFCNGAAGSQTLNARMRAAAYQVSVVYACTEWHHVPLDIC